MENQNSDGERLMEFADSFDMVVVNVFFKINSEKLIIFLSLILV